MGLDPAKYFIIIPNMFGNGLSSSPSNTPEPFDRARFPRVTVYDNVRAQHRLVTEKFGISKIKLVLGWSMGAGQTYQWAVSHPEMVENILPFCGAAKTSVHNVVFLEGVKFALMGDPLFNNGWYTTKLVQGPRAMGRVYAGWGLSQEFYRLELYKEMGFNSLEDFLVGYWEDLFLRRRDPNDLLSQLWTWQNGNIGLTPGFDGHFEKALAAIKARAIVMPAKSDLYFPPEDNEYEVRHMPNAEFRVLVSPYGHFAGGGIKAEDTAFIDRVVKELLK